MMAKVYTVMSPNKSLVVNISVDKTLKWEIKSGKTIVLLPSEIALQTDKQCLGKNMKVKKSSICNNKVGNRKYQGSPDKLGGKILNFPEKVIPLCHE